MPPPNALRMLTLLLGCERLREPDRTDFQAWLNRIEVGAVKTLSAKQRERVEALYFRFGLNAGDPAEARAEARRDRPAPAKRPFSFETMAKPLRPPSRKDA